MRARGGRRLLSAIKSLVKRAIPEAEESNPGRDRYLRRYENRGKYGRGLHRRRPATWRSYQ